MIQIICYDNGMNVTATHIHLPPDFPAKPAITQVDAVMAAISTALGRTYRAGLLARRWVITEDRAPIGDHSTGNFARALGQALGRTVTHT